jgi:hypothetical protein
MKKRFLAALSALLAALAITGCGKTVTWKEDVQLSDGRVIVIERATERVGGGDDLAHGGSGSRPATEIIRLTDPIGSGRQVVEWRSTKTDSHLWPEVPLVLDVENGNLFVIAGVTSSDSCITYSKYVFNSGALREELLPERFEKRRPNLLIMNGPSMPKSVDLATKNRENDDIRYPKGYREIGPRRTWCEGVKAD